VIRDLLEIKARLVILVQREILVLLEIKAQLVIRGQPVT
jgi:hypothetical protein